MKSLDIKGEYVFRIPITTMFLNTFLEIKRSNLITFYGESFFLNRMINDTFNPIEYLCLGNATIKATKKDLTLGNETIRKKCARSVDLDKKQIILTTTFDLKEVYGTSEIGVANDTVLISHDTYSPLTDDFLSPNTGEIEIIYTFTIRTGSYKYGWTLTNMSKVYYAAEPNNVVSVFEANGTGYRKVSRKNDLNNITETPAFYYDARNKNIYVKTLDGNNPDYMDIIIQTE